MGQEARHGICFALPLTPPRQTARMIFVLALLLGLETTQYQQKLEPADDWPEGYIESFTGVPDDFSRPPQGKVDKRAALR